jgi:tRNA 2-thiouridine synthesizing protein A
MDGNHPQSELDVTGLLCPLPVLKAGKRLKAMAPGEVLVVRASDAMSKIDMPHFCNEQGHQLLSADEQDGIFIFRIRCK